MKRLLLALALLALALPASAAAGGWATVQLSSTPAGTKAGGTWTPELTVLQHGRTPLEGVTPVIRIVGAGGEADQFAAKPTGTPGHYRAEVTFPASGEWRWEIWDGFSQTHTYTPVTIARGGSETPFPTAPVAGGLLAALGLAALGFLVLRRRRLAPQPALDG
jgi:ABC-type branched-subunit amino acid transport system permease subunit